MTSQTGVSIWNTKDLQNPHLLADKQKRVRKMFGNLAGAYDLANHVLSLNLDRYWRRKTIDLLDIKPGHRALDLCCGTGDLAMAIANTGIALSEIIGVDCAEPMLHQAMRKSLSRPSKKHKPLSPKWLCSDSEMTCFPDQYFDRVCCGFGLRNMQNPAQFLCEIYRLLNRGGRVVILEFAIPRNPLIQWAYQCYFRLVLPIVGSIISADRNRSYHYLAGSVCSFPGPEKLKHYFLTAGFCHVEVAPLSGGIVMVYQAEKL